MDIWIVAIFLLALLAVLALIVAARPRRQAEKVQSSLGRLENFDPRSFRQAELAQPVGTRLVSPAFARLAVAGRAITPTGRLRRMQFHVEQAGRPWNLDVNGLLAVKVVSLLLAVLVVAVVAGLSWLSTPWLVLLGCSLGLAAYYLPDTLIAVWKGRRRRAISGSLPDLLDLLTVTVEAGLGLESSLARIASRVRGPLSEEILITLHHMRIGQSRDVALREMARRCGDPDLEHFVATLIQSQQLGVSLGSILRSQSTTIRTVRRQRVEEAAQKAPVKMLFPLVFCIFPSLFVVILGPAAIRIYHVFID